MNTTATELDLALAPGFESELRCESRHKDPNNRVCSGRVTALKQRRCLPSFLVCQSSYSWNLYIIENNGNDACSGCGKRLEDCWKVVPV